MRSVLLALAAVLVFSTVVNGANLGRRNFGAYGASSNNSWYKGYGRAGYGWYNSYGDYVGNDGYTTIRATSRANFGQSLGYPPPPYGYSRAHNYGY